MRLSLMWKKENLQVYRWNMLYIVQNSDMLEQFLAKIQNLHFRFSLAYKL